MPKNGTANALTASITHTFVRQEEPRKDESAFSGTRTITEVRQEESDADPSYVSNYAIPKTRRSQCRNHSYSDFKNHFA